MHYILALTQPNIISIILMLLVIISFSRKMDKHSFGDVLFIVLASSVFFISFFEILAYIFDNQTFYGAIFINRLVNAVLFAMVPVCFYVWSLFICTKMYNNTKTFKKHAILLAIPSVCMILLSFLNMFFDIFFTISPENTYSRTDLFIIVIAFHYLYFFYSLFIVLFNFKNISKSVSIPIILLMVFPIMGAMVQSLYYPISTLWISVSVAVVIDYIYVLNDTSVKDWLTGLYNRKHLDNYLKLLCSKKLKSNEFLVGLMMDINGFKKINDTFGHIEGDKALQITAKLLKEVIYPKKYLSRFAGDEFVIIFKTSNKHDIEYMIETITSKFDAYNKSSSNGYIINLSIGHAIYDTVSNDTPIEFLIRMDEKMYKKKRISSLPR